MTLSELGIADHLPATFTAPGLSEAEFLALCAQFPDAMVEYTADGTVVLLPLSDPEASGRVMEAAAQLTNWAHAQGRGHVTGPDAGFLLPDGSRRSPDAAWFDDARWREAKKSGELFPVFAPDFVIEVRLPDYRVSLLREKMEEYIENGIQLGWLIDPKERTVAIYRSCQAPQVLTNPSSVAGDGPVVGFVLDLGRIFAHEH